MPLDSFPSSDYIRSILDYWPETGVLRWRQRQDQDAQWNGRYAGTVAGFENGDGAVRVAINDHKYLAHRVIWAWMTGERPPNLIDHEDLDRSNNRWENLRAATKSQNCANSRLQRNNTSGIKGVSWSKAARRWQVHITKDKKQRFLGLYNCIGAAACVRDIEANIAFGEFARAA